MCEDRTGISLSGGGVRGAIFHMGALQVMAEQGILQQVDAIAAVSGGSYIAGALLISASESERELLQHSFPWAAGSPEDVRFREMTDYLFPGALGRLWFTLNVVYGVVLNYLPILIGIGLAGRGLGWLLYWLDQAKMEALPLVAGGSLIVLSLVVNLIRRALDHDWFAARKRAAMRLKSACLILATAGIGLVALLSGGSLLTDGYNRVTGARTSRIPNRLFADIPLIRLTWAVGIVVSLLALGAIAVLCRSFSRRLSVLLDPLAAFCGYALLIRRVS